MGIRPLTKPHKRLLQAIIRCLYGYFMGLSQDELPYIKASRVEPYRLSATADSDPHK
jgi:hypothetical protein